MDILRTLSNCTCSHVIAQQLVMALATFLADLRKLKLDVAHWHLELSSGMCNFPGNSSSNEENSMQEERMAQAAAIGRTAMEPCAGLLAGLVQERLEALPCLAQAGQNPDSILALYQLGISAALQCLSQKIKEVCCRSRVSAPWHFGACPSTALICMLHWCFSPVIECHHRALMSSLLLLYPCSV